VTERRRAFRFGVNGTTSSPVEWQETARKAEALGFDTLIIQDHLDQQLAPLPALVAAAAVTTRLRLAALVLDNDFRHPALVAREAATVDVFSGGRMELGLGAGWLEADYARAGIAFDAPGVRLGRLAEAVRLCRAYFGRDSAPLSFQGEYYRLDGLEPWPRPVQRHLPLMVGGRQKRALSLAAREADIVGISLLDRRLPGQPPPTPFAEKIGWIREAAGPRFGDLELHVNAALVEIGDRPSPAVEQYATRMGISLAEALASPGTFVGSVDGIVELLEARREQHGVSYYVVHVRNIDALAQVIARI
jgi:probable F420-dependent oxidoreductase